ncbi:MAG: HAD family hydrolase [Desulfobacteraceae bacterium]|jgi:HAD superfamily hydrolase (TIGR01484 family)|nr:HAD family hydrolase [Desulfobacteraceae bacterium]
MTNSGNYKLEDPTGNNPPGGLFIMDLDGTLLRSDRTFGGPDLEALKMLGDLNVIRAIATGRSLASFDTVIVSDLPVDYIIFSTGAGVMRYPTREIIRKVHLEPHKVIRACAVLNACRLDFMVHCTIPDNHMFAYSRSHDGNSDFERRIELYKQFAVPLEDAAGKFGPATQLLAVVPPGNADSALERIRAEMPDFNVIQTTSPLDGKSTWIEIFPSTVSKSQTAAWLADALGIDRSSIVSVGNDYNDLDLLEWTASSYVVNNAPPDIKSRFTCVASNNDGGVAEAARCWMETRCRV